jgi:predicted RNA-binding Zn-ribbon protein involved in translation (DUF1610 family)
MVSKTMKVVCNSCGRAFAAFLRDMAEQNTKVVCPACGEEYVKSKAADAVHEFCATIQEPKKRR